MLSSGNFICWHFRTLCLFHLHRQIGVDRAFRNIAIDTGNYPEESIQHVQNWNKHTWKRIVHQVGYLQEWLWLIWNIINNRRIIQLDKPATYPLGTSPNRRGCSYLLQSSNKMFSAYNEWNIYITADIRACF